MSQIELFSFSGEPEMEKQFFIDKNFILVWSSCFLKIPPTIRSHFPFSHSQGHFINSKVIKLLSRMLALQWFPGKTSRIKSIQESPKWVCCKGTFCRSTSVPFSHGSFLPA